MMSDRGLKVIDIYDCGCEWILLNYYFSFENEALILSVQCSNLLRTFPSLVKKTSKKN